MAVIAAKKYQAILKNLFIFFNLKMTNLMSQWRSRHSILERKGNEFSQSECKHRSHHPSNIIINSNVCKEDDHKWMDTQHSNFYIYECLIEWEHQEGN